MTGGKEKQRTKEHPGFDHAWWGILLLFIYYFLVACILHVYVSRKEIEKRRRNDISSLEGTVQTGIFEFQNCLVQKVAVDYR